MVWVILHRLHDIPGHCWTGLSPDSTSGVTRISGDYPVYRNGTEQAEDQARANEQSLNEFLENRTIADIVEQFTQDENCEWLMHNDFFMGNNGSFATVREVSEASHDIMMGDTLSSDVSKADAECPREVRPARVLKA